MNANIKSLPRMTSLGFDPKPYPQGIHMCFIFDNDDERRDVLAKFVQSGLDNDEQVVYFVDTMTPEELKASLRSLGVTIPDDEADTSCLIYSAEQTYCPDGTFQVERMLTSLEQAYDHCCTAGYAGLRVSGETTWVLKHLLDSDHLIEYESKVTLLLQSVPVTAICQYDARLFDGEMLYRLLMVHPMMIVRGQVVQNPYFVQPINDTAY
jgi:hypothetical protein